MFNRVNVNYHNSVDISSQFLHIQYQITILAFTEKLCSYINTMPFLTLAVRVHMFRQRHYSITTQSAMNIQTRSFTYFDANNDVYEHTTNGKLSTL